MFTLPKQFLTKMTALSIAIVAFSTHSTVINFDGIGDVNAYIFNDFIGKRNDSQGSLIVGGNTHLTGYTVATLNNDNQLALFTKGDLTINGGDINGLSSVGGSALVNNTNALSETTANYNVDQTHFKQLSQLLSSQSNTSNHVQWSTLQLETEGDNDTIITNLDYSSIADFTSVQTTSDSLDFRIVFNISGIDIDLTPKDWLIKSEHSIFSASNILFNFFEAKSLTINTALYGSVLAPSADVLGNGGMIYGQLIANSFTTGLNGSGTQLNAAVFNSDVVEKPRSVVKASTPNMTLVSLLMLTLLVVSRIKPYKCSQSEACN